MTHEELLGESPPKVEPDIVRAPWTEIQVQNLNARQADPTRHPYTCGTKEDHLPSQRGNEATMLVATPSGWRCTICSYTQDWAHRMDTLTTTQQVDAYLAKGGIILTEEEKEKYDKLLD